jgi:hypothetical protein
VLLHLEPYSHRVSNDKIYFVCTERGESPVRRYIEELDELTIEMTGKLLDQTELLGPPRSQSKFRHLSGAVVEFKVHKSRAVRYLGFRIRQGWTITAATDKPKATELRRLVTAVQALHDRMEAER